MLSVLPELSSHMSVFGRRFEHASAFVFIGTSFAVGVTADAIQIAEQHGIPCFQFNINVPVEVRSRRKLKMMHIIGLNPNP